MSQSSTPGRRALGLALGLGLGLSGCTHLEVRFQSLPDAAAFGAIRPGETTRSDVLRLLGPPEEYRRPSPGEWERRSAPQRLKIIRGGDVFGRDVYTYATERRIERRLGIMPPGLPVIGVELLHVTWLRWEENRFLIAFDDNGVVSQVAHLDESEDD